MRIDVSGAARREAMRKYGFGTEEMKKIKVCPACGAAQPCGSEVCSYCGSLLSDETLFDLYKKRHVVCNRCGEVVADGAKYCPQCGKRINYIKNNRV